MNSAREVRRDSGSRISLRLFEGWSCRRRSWRHPLVSQTVFDLVTRMDRRVARGDRATTAVTPTRWVSRGAVGRAIAAPNQDEGLRHVELAS